MLIIKSLFLEAVNRPIIYQSIVSFIFVLFTSLLFLFLNNIQPAYYIDEVFHVPQTQKYCNGSFLEWDKKITTLPGLYILSAILLAPFKLCVTIYLRGINLIGTFINLYLIYQILSTKKWVQKCKAENKSWLPLMVSLSITLLPPLYFWHFLYYTDVLSVNLVLTMFLLHERQCYKYSAIVGALGILVRQTNVIWLILLIGERILTIIEAETPQSISALRDRGIYGTSIHARLIWNNVRHYTQRGIRPFASFLMDIISHLKYQSVVILSFVVFIIWNKGIVLGDRSAHVPTIHLPQLFYFSIFTSGFAWPYMLPHVKSYIQWIYKHWIITSLCLLIMTVIVHSNTLVHPYLLADNRHYVFYIWNKFMGRYHLAKYILIPFYGFSVYATVMCLQDMRYLSKVLYAGCISAVLIPQLLLEPRYFIIPYILIRLNFREPKLWQMSFELMTTLIINFIQFYIFVTKTFYWTDQEGPQRLSW
ncbi:putative Dol-P-Glc:Glc(2)Man(9)GlcNAc(2)-PP-Dol alpha-1,2-glucosyltransferase [Microplitis mediator]|uniref:putative Dol-P-Glc:Glc(2)Man(9)GlcNAc(2)-PP-Dol alpha-1,2-glucosyltransferase n=1 Tax=Microplitis mediator TaxID=375433 RepID=UPI002556E46B|nr:putative Dol-P-Glc:Glc(2)Man(9)GlcNAc(2)-PP-Dol alpha-1,2-glucosyltransferase [Microplitis mediator]